MDIGGYLEQVAAKYRSGQATEHSYRPALQSLFESIDPALTVINEPKKSDAGMPDFLFQRGTIPLGWCEAKDVDRSFKANLLPALEPDEFADVYAETIME